MSVLPAPPKTLKDRLLKTLEVHPSTLFRISRAMLIKSKSSEGVRCALSVR